MRIGLIGVIGLFLAGGATAGGLFGAARNISGAYIITYTDGAEMLQIVEAPDGSFTGHLSGVIVDSAWRVREESGALTGAVDGGSITLQVQGAGPFRLPGSVSGSIRPDRLDLSAGDGAGPGFVARHAAASDFESIARTWRETGRKRAEALAAAASEAARRSAAEAARRTALLASIQHYVDETAAIAGHLVATDAKAKKFQDDLQAFTTRMSATLDRGKSQLSGADEGEAHRRHLKLATDVALVGLDRNMLRIEMESYANELSKSLSVLQVGAQRDRSDCEGIKAAATPAGGAAESGLVATACDRLAAAAAAFQPSAEAVRAIVTRLRTTLRVELEAQQDIETAAQRTK